MINTARPMRLYIESLAPNARRVGMYLVEKNIDVQRVLVDVQHGEHKKTEFLNKNPMGQVPVLELLDGTCISESISICQYIEDLHPIPNLFGTSGRDRAEIDMWQRRVEFGIFSPGVEYGHHASSLFCETIQQIPELASLCKQQLLSMWKILDSELALHKFIAPYGFSIADITAYVGSHVALLWGIPIPSELERVIEWYARIDRRPSAEVIKYHIGGDNGI